MKVKITGEINAQSMAELIACVHRNYGKQIFGGELRLTLFDEDGYEIKEDQEFDFNAGGARIPENPEERERKRKEKIKKYVEARLKEEREKERQQKEEREERERYLSMKQENETRRAAYQRELDHWAALPATAQEEVVEALDALLATIWKSLTTRPAMRMGHEGFELRIGATRRTLQHPLYSWGLSHQPFWEGPVWHTLPLNENESIVERNCIEAEWIGCCPALEQHFYALAEAAEMDAALKHSADGKARSRENRL